MSEKLLPCPFCGGEAEIIPWWQNRERYHVRCKTAECNYTHDNRADAAAAWNRRAAPSADDEQETAPHAAPQSEGVNTTEPNLDLIASVEADLQEIVSARRTIEQAQHCDNYTDAARARRDDPATSRSAARRSRSFAQAHADAILSALRSWPATIHELAARTGIDAVAVARRMSELQRSGAAVPTNETRPSPSGSPCRVWRLA